MASERTGSRVSERQLLQAVVDGTPVQVVYDSDRKIDLVVWVAGWDDYHWKFVDAEGHTILVHKTKPAYIKALGADHGHGEPGPLAITIIEAFKNHLARKKESTSAA